MHLPEKQKKDVNVPTDEDVKELLRVVKGHYLELPVMLAAFGPMRRGEICALRSQNIAQNVVHVCENMVLDKDNQWRVKSPKTAAGDRFIEYPDFVRELWQGKTGRIVTVNPNKLTTDFRNLLRRNNLPAFRFHDLRHSYAVLSLLTGANLKMLSSQLGHATVAFTLDVYGHDHYYIRVKCRKCKFDELIDTALFRTLGRRRLQSRYRTKKLRSIHKI